MNASQRSGWGLTLGLAALGAAIVGLVAPLTVGAQQAAPAAAASAPAVTFTRDIAPILQRSCQNCHRPNQVAPMSLITYEEVRPWARAIRQRTAIRDKAGAMPPWYIEKNIGIQQYKHDPSLSDEEVAKIAQWVEAGAPARQRRRHAGANRMAGRGVVVDRRARPDRRGPGDRREGRRARLVGRPRADQDSARRGPLRRGGRDQGSQRRPKADERPPDRRPALRLPPLDLVDRGDRGEAASCRRAPGSARLAGSRGGPQRRRLRPGRRPPAEGGLLHHLRVDAPPLERPRHQVAPALRLQVPPEGLQADLSQHAARARQRRRHRHQAERGQPAAARLPRCSSGR